MIQLSETRYIRIEETSVALEVSTDDEAKVALKELRHKKREYLHVKRRLVAAIKEHSPAFIVRRLELKSELSMVEETLLHLEEAVLYVQGKLISKGIIS